MRYRKFGRSGLAISRFALGTMYFGSETSQDDAFAIIARCVEAGGDALDTADVCVGGKSEATVGTPGKQVFAALKPVPGQ